MVDDSGVLSMAADDLPTTNKTNAKAGTTAPLLQRRARALPNVWVTFCACSRFALCADPRFK